MVLKNFCRFFQFFSIFFRFLFGRKVTIDEILHKMTGLCYSWDVCASIIVRLRVLVASAAMPMTRTIARSANTNIL